MAPVPKATRVMATGILPTATPATAIPGMVMAAVTTGQPIAPSTTAAMASLSLRLYRGYRPAYRLASYRGYRPAYRSASYRGYRPAYRPAVYGGYRSALRVAIRR